MCVMNEFSFRLGFSQVMKKDLVGVKQKIMTALGISTRASWLRRLKGEVEPKVSEVKAIEEIFLEYGINKIWGGDE